MANNPALERLKDIADGYRGSMGEFLLNAADAAALTEFSGQEFKPGKVKATRFVNAVDQAASGGPHKPIAVRKSESESEHPDNAEDLRSETDGVSDDAEPEQPDDDITNVQKDLQREKQEKKEQAAEKREAKARKSQARRPGKRRTI